MGIYHKIRGSIETIFQFGLNRAQIRAQTIAGPLEVLEVRNPTDSAYARLRVDTPVDNNDAVTKAYADAIANGEFVIRFTIGLVTADSVMSIPAGMRVLHSTLDVTTPYTAGTTISLGTPASAAAYMATTDNDATAANTYVIPDQDVLVGVSAVVRATVAGAPVAGAATVIVYAALTQA